MMTMRFWFVIVGAFLVSHGVAECRLIRVGPGRSYANLQPAATAAAPGDTIVFDAGIYAGGQYVTGLKGTPSAWITLRCMPGDSAIVRGGNEAWHLTDPAYVRVEGFVFEQQTANGVNIDDGGDYATPAHHIRVLRCTFRNMSGTGNNDLLKLSGLDDFEIRESRFIAGAAGGSGIDMVGCHRGTIEKNEFRQMGSNAIQAKGGTEHVTIAANYFEQCGSRTLNLGGSTGLQYFRPIDAPFEAANLRVHANIIVGSEAPVAYVGCVKTEVVNNTIFKPGKWVVRILQETVDTARFLSCGENTFQNNIVLQGNLPTETNIGPNTRPWTFVYAHNVWYNAQNSVWGGPSIPVADPWMIVGANPLFADTASRDFRPIAGSRAIGAGGSVASPTHDFLGAPFNTPRSAGAIEGNPPALAVEGFSWTPESRLLLSAYPNPFNPVTRIRFQVPGESGRSGSRSVVSVVVYDIQGRPVRTLHDGPLEAGPSVVEFNGKGLSSGIYLCRLRVGSALVSLPLILTK